MTKKRELYVFKLLNKEFVVAQVDHMPDDEDSFHSIKLYFPLLINPEYNQELGTYEVKFSIYNPYCTEYYEDIELFHVLGHPRTPDPKLEAGYYEQLGNFYEMDEMVLEITAQDENYSDTQKEKAKEILLKKEFTDSEVQ